MNGIWTSKDAEHHQTSEKLAAWILKTMQQKKLKSFIDYGCGNGYYVNYLNTHGMSGCGIDGNEAGVVYKDKVYYKDLTHPIKIITECAISLEVGEHLPKESQETFMKNTCNLTKNLLIISWAEIGQAGIGHINCRSQEDVIKDVESRGYKLDKELTQEARENIDDNTDWFRRTLLIFNKI